MSLLELDAVDAYYGESHILRDLSFTVEDGDICALLGRNGAGKTTTISMLTGLLPPTSGEMRVNGLDVVRALPAVRRHLGVCPQQDVLFPTLPVLEHLRLYATIKRVPRDACDAS